MGKPQLTRFGESASPVVVVDGVSGDWRRIAAIAGALGAFPPSAANYYPGLRRVISEADAAAYAYVVQTLETIAPYIGGAFGLDGFDLLEASFSLVTTLPQDLQVAQRAPHFDAYEPDRLAVLHYLMDAPNAGTAFYRQRSTGIERVTADNAATFIAETTRAVEAGECDGYITGTNAAFEQIGMVPSAPDRLLIYQGSLLHSGVITPALSLSEDPAKGRLTANFFLRGMQAR